MGLNVSASNSFENREQLRNTANQILTNYGATREAVVKILEANIFDKVYSSTNPQLSIIKASTQISVNNTLNETLRYLKSHANQKIVRTPVLGELWSIIEANNKNSENNPYKGELYDFQIDSNAKNIFAA